MTKAGKGKPRDGLIRKGEPDNLEIEQREGEAMGRTLARVSLDPLPRHASLAGSFASQVFCNDRQPSTMDTVAVLGEQVAKAVTGDLTIASRILASQAISLDTLFTEMARRSGTNIGEYPEAMERYMRLALKAQSACRSTLEALAKLHQPREQTVKHVHVNQGAQAVVADQFHHHTGGEENGKSIKQSDALGVAGQRAALPCPYPLGHGVPIPSREGEAAVPNARRD